MDSLFTLLAWLYQFEYVKSMLDPEMLSKVTWWTLGLGIAWKLQKKEVNKFVGEAKKQMADIIKTFTEHFGEMQKTVDTGMKELRSELKDFKTVVEKDLEHGTHRMDDMEVRIKNLETTNHN